MVTTRSGAGVSSPPPPPPRRARPPPPPVGPLPFDPDDFTSPNISRTALGRGRIAFAHVLDILDKWSDYGWARFLFSDPLCEEREPSRDDWVPRYPLGKGGFGRVGLWAKLNDRCEPEDHIAIKEIQMHHIGLYSVGLPREAVIQGHLTAMRDGKEVIAQMRRYKFFPHPRVTLSDKARLYLDFAPCGTLNDLRYRYRAL